MNTRSVAIIKQRDVVGKAMQHLYLMHAERRPRIGHHILYATLMHGNNVGVAFDHINIILLGNGTLSLIDAIEFVVFMIDFAIGRIDIFLIYAFRSRV